MRDSRGGGGGGGDVLKLVLGKFWFVVAFFDVVWLLYSPFRHFICHLFSAGGDVDTGGV